jgi:hypothetical protein
MNISGKIDVRHSAIFGNIPIHLAVLRGAPQRGLKKRGLRIGIIG